jgi:hypothetical protein
MITLRAAALAGNDRATLLTTADALHRLGSRYQAARTLVLAGDPESAQGRAQFAQPPLQILDHGSELRSFLAACQRSGLHGPSSGPQGAV